MKNRELAGKFYGVSTARISDAMSRMGLKDRTMGSIIKPVCPRMKLAGTAVTAECYPGGTHASGLAIEAAGPGDVIVLDGKGYTEAVLWGEIFSMMAMSRGVCGTVVHGAVRDVEEVAELGYPLFAAGVTPACGTGDKLGRVNVAVSCAGVVVNPGDYVVGDVLGVVVVPAERAGEVIRMCGEVLEKEEKIIGELALKLKGPDNGRGGRARE